MNATRLALAIAIAVPLTASAAAPSRTQVRDVGLEAKAVRVRTNPRLSWRRAPKTAMVAWSRSHLAAAGWDALWDEATGVPLRMFGRAIAAPGASQTAATALAHARATLAADIDVLAPGARASDFVLAANVERRGVRTVAFHQLADGLRVLGGQVSFRYKRDHLIAIASEALPHVKVVRPARAVERGIGRLLATTWVMADVGAPIVGGAVDGPYILPLVGDGGVLGYETVLRVAAEGHAPRGKWDVYVDAGSGAPVARRQLLKFAAGDLHFDVPLRHPDDERVEVPARDATVMVDGDATTTDEDGHLEWSGGGAVTLGTRVSGPFVEVTNQAGNEASTDLALAPGGVAVWSAPDDEAIDAQLSAFVHAREVKDFARARFAGGLDWLDTQLPVNVNIDDSCNAFSDGDSINFFQSSAQCANTGRLADVVYHEFGHSLHAHSIIEGAGAFDSAFSEGLSDYLAATMTNDPAMGRGFFKDSSPLRHLDPPDREARWPDDISEAHTTGLIFAGAMWDLRKLMIEKYGADDGALLSDRLFYGAVQRASSIPATYVEILVEDDDDGDLSNGTPNACEINAAFAAHGLRKVDVEVTPLATVGAGGDGTPVGVRVGGLLPQCPGDGVAGATLTWTLRDAAEGTEPNAVEMVEVDGEWTGAIPGQDDGAVVRYAVAVEFLDGSSQTFPDNPADPRYELYVGEVVELYCTGFESDPFADDWTHGLSAGDAEEGADDWRWGTPVAGGAAGDPDGAFAGDGAIGNDLGGGDYDGTYQPDKTNFATGPAISVAVAELDGARYSDVRLQYWRWLNVEDAFFDQATIYADGEQVWQNLNSDNGDDSATQHTDREWRFQDVPLAAALGDDDVELTFELASDGGLEFGGWTIDEVCVVAAAGKICGDGELIDPEQCDDGAANSDSEPDACRRSCRPATCGDGVVDSGETCDDGNLADGDGCAATCGVEADGGGCGCRVVGQPAGPSGGVLALTLLGLIGIVRIRRRV